FRQLYPNRKVPELLVRYSGRFKGYNATVQGTWWSIQFNLSKRFLETSDEIKIGVMQHLLNKLNNTKKETLEQDLYSTFTKKLTDYAPVNKVDKELQKVFDDVNDEYFNGFMMTPNLQWGKGINLLGHYTFATDTITISEVLREDPTLLKFVMYHEMLHKKHKFDERPGGYTRTHTKAFRDDEKKFKVKDVEKRLEAFVQRKKREQRAAGKRPKRRLLWWWQV
ncbi:hypothetical protein D6789_04795, partial [Candidatus Woesearchaeota archaeon]